MTDTHQWSIDSLSGLCRGIIHSPLLHPPTVLHDVTAPRRLIEFGCTTATAQAFKPWGNKHKKRVTRASSLLFSACRWYLQPHLERQDSPGGGGGKSQCANTHRWKQNTTFWQTQSHTGALLHTCMHIQAPPSPVCIAPKRGAASFSKPVFHDRGGQGDSALLIHILRCLLSHSLLFFSPALKEQTTWNIIAERINQSVSALSRLSSKDEVFLGLFVILPYTEEPSRTALYVYCSLCTYVLGLCSRVGRGRGGLLWQHEVNQHSVHVAFHYELGQTAEDYSSAQIYNNRQTSPESAVTKTPAVCSCMEWHSNSSHRRDYLTYLGAWGGSNMIYF